MLYLCQGRLRMFQLRAVVGSSIFLALVLIRVSGDVSVTGLAPWYTSLTGTCGYISTTRDMSWSTGYRAHCLNSILVQAGAHVTLRYIDNGIDRKRSLFTMTVSPTRNVAVIQNEYLNITYAYIGPTRLILGGILPPDIPDDGVVFTWTRIADTQLSGSVWVATHAFMTDDGIVAFKVYVPRLAGVTGTLYSKGPTLAYVILDTNQIVVNPLAILSISFLQTSLQNNVIVGGMDDSFNLYVPVTKIVPTRASCGPTLIEDAPYLIITRTVGTSTVYAYKSTEMEVSRLKLNTATCYPLADVTGLPEIIQELFTSGIITVGTRFVKFPGTPCVGIVPGTSAEVRFDVYGTNTCTAIISNLDPSLQLLTPYANNTIMYQCGNMS